MVVGSIPTGGFGPLERACARVKNVACRVGLERVRTETPQLNGRSWRHGAQSGLRFAPRLLRNTALLTR